MNLRILLKLISIVLLLAFSSSNAFSCPDIDGLVDLNCDRKLIIVAFGDSITYGRADPNGLGYPGRLKLHHFPNAIIINLGKPGEDTVRGKARAARTLPAYLGADYVIVLEGVNDYWLRNRSSYKTRNNVLSIVSTAQNIGAVTLLGNLTEIKRSRQKGWVSSVNSRLNPYRQIDFYSLGEGIISSDLIHPNGNGYNQMAALAASMLIAYSAANRPVDSDGDGIYDFAEAWFGTDPFNPDTDGDTLLDGAEVFIWGSNPLLLDSDGDGFDDPTEVNIMGSNPADPRPGAPYLESLEALRQ